jgi:hypothetical protein
LNVRERLHRAILQEVLETKYTIIQIAQGKSRNVREIEGNFVLEVFEAAVEMGTSQTRAWLVRCVRRVAVGRATEIEPRKNQNFSGPGLILQPCAVPVAALKIEEELFTSVQGPEFPLEPGWLRIRELKRIANDEFFGHLQQRICF